jgi:hypothetical protein
MFSLMAKGFLTLQQGILTSVTVHRNCKDTADHVTGGFRVSATVLENCQISTHALRCKSLEGSRAASAVRRAFLYGKEEAQPYD